VNSGLVPRLDDAAVEFDLRLASFPSARQPASFGHLQFAGRIMSRHDSHLASLWGISAVRRVQVSGISQWIRRSSSLRRRLVL
jgi:hypothetical protein